MFHSFSVRFRLFQFMVPWSLSYRTLCSLTDFCCYQAIEHHKVSPDMDMQIEIAFLCVEYYCHWLSHNHDHWYLCSTVVHLWSAAALAGLQAILSLWPHPSTASSPSTTDYRLSLFSVHQVTIHVLLMLRNLCTLREITQICIKTTRIWRSRNGRTKKYTNQSTRGNNPKYFF